MRLTVAQNRTMFSELIDRYRDAVLNANSAMYETTDEKKIHEANERERRLYDALLDGAFPAEPDLPHVPDYKTYTDTAQFFTTQGFGSTREITALTNLVWGPEAYHLRKIIETMNEHNVPVLFLRTPNCGRTTTRLVLQKLIDKGYIVRDTALRAANSYLSNEGLNR